jgi:hypothetical protein
MCVNMLKFLLLTGIESSNAKCMDTGSVELSGLFVDILGKSA